MSEASAVTEDVVTRSIRMLADHGYMETTVEQLAQAAGISRATFFRKYGSKEDVVFADHAATLERLEALLQRPGLSPQDGLVEGAQLVFRHNLDHAQRAFARHDLLQRVESLRDREIAMSSRYERVFHAFLRAALPDSPDRRVTAVALPAATVAVHNAFLRTWLRGPRPGQGEQLAAALSRRVVWLCALFGVTHQETAPSGSPADLSFSSAQVSLELDDAAAPPYAHGSPSPAGRPTANDAASSGAGAPGSWSPAGATAPAGTSSSSDASAGDAAAPPGAAPSGPPSSGGTPSSPDVSADDDAATPEAAPSGPQLLRGTPSALYAPAEDDAATPEADPPGSSAGAPVGGGVDTARGRDVGADPDGSAAGPGEHGEPALANPRGGVVGGNRTDTVWVGGDAPIVVLVPRGGDPADVAERTARSVYEALRG